VVLALIHVCRGLPLEAWPKVVRGCAGRGREGAAEMPERTSMGAEYGREQPAWRRAMRLRLATMTHRSLGKFLSAAPVGASCIWCHDR